MTDQQPLQLDPSVLCRCWLGDGKFLCDTPRVCGLIPEKEEGDTCHTKAH